MGWKKRFQDALENEMNLWVQDSDPTTSEICSHIIETYFAEYVDIVETHDGKQEICVGFIVNNRIEEVIIYIY